MIDIIGMNLGMKGQGGQNGKLIGGVDALDIVCRVGFCVTQLLGLL